mmetsp:Transcript_22262/g.16721  ORF Transcript_22262/g.16721 Transcript_22262/m.16721 type:complete len:269 (-) Transcript_22262:1359-2165(-)
MIYTIVSGKDHKRNPVSMEGIRCIDVCIPVVEEVEIDDEISYWSNVSTWITNKVPEAGENAEIQPGKNVFLDIDTPILGHLEINGRLTFMDDRDLHLQAHTIFIRQGELIIGSEDEPHQHLATITLHGEQESQYMVFANNIEAGDKMITNLGKLQAVGMSRDYEIQRLLSPVKPGSKSIYLPEGLDWTSGDKIGLAPTTLVFNDSDYATIATYDADTGRATLVEALTGYHWGAEESTEDDYGVDMRGEVFLLSRNVKIQGYDNDAWGC